MKKRSALTGSIAIILICTIFAIVCLNQNITLIINAETASYIVCYSRGLGPKKLDYAEHQETLDEIFGMLSGEYRYIRFENFSGRSGGSSDTLYLYDECGELINAIHYLNVFLYVPAYRKGKYYVYRNVNGILDFSSLENLLDF